MTTHATPESDTSSCGTSGFSYCFWAKLLVAIPAIPLIALAAASFFSDPVGQSVAAVVAVVVTVCAARKLDQLPKLQRKVISKS